MSLTGPDNADFCKSRLQLSEAPVVTLFVRETKEKKCVMGKNAFISESNTLLKGTHNHNCCHSA